MGKFIKAIMRISFIFYAIILIALLFLRPPIDTSELTFFEYIKYYTNIIPFKTIGAYFNVFFDERMVSTISIENLVGNLILFLPMGIYFPYFVSKLNSLSFYSTAIIILLFTLEIIQLTTRRGVFDIDDIILNMIGALIGFAIWKTKFIQRFLWGDLH